MSYQEFRPSRFGNIPVVTKNIIIINVILFISSRYILADKINLDIYLSLFDIGSPYFKPHQLITHMFMHADESHIFFNMFGLYMFGSILENVWGAKRFLNFYLLCGLGAALLQLGIDYYNNSNSVMLGASGAIFGLLAAFAMMFPNTMLHIYFMFPIKAKYFVLIYAAAELFMGISPTQQDGIAHFAHLGGAAVGAIIVLLWKKNRNFFF